MAHRIVAYAAAAIAAAVVSVSAAGVGDPGSVYDASKDDSNFPLMKEWAKAGVEGGIPLRSSTAPTKTINPGDNIQTAVNGMGTGGGVILLKKGDYLVTGPIQMKSNVVLRGEGGLDTRVMASTNNNDAIVFDGVQKAGLEDLGILNYRAQQIGPVDPYWYNYTNNTASGEKVPSDGQALGEGSSKLVQIKSSSNCWVDNCYLGFSFDNNMRIENSQHITCRGNFTFVSQQSRDEQGAYYVNNSSYCLFYQEKIELIGSLWLANGSHHNVFLNCEGGSKDPNYNNSGAFVMITTNADNNLFEGHFTEISKVFSKGLLDISSGDNNYFLNCYFKSRDAALGQAAMDANKVYRTNGTGFAAASPSTAKAGTLYPVSGTVARIAYPPEPKFSRIDIHGVAVGDMSWVDVTGECKLLTFYVTHDAPAAGTTLKYEWIFGDGVVQITDVPYVDHNYKAMSIYIPKVSTMGGLFKTTGSSPGMIMVNSSSPADCQFQVDAASRAPAGRMHQYTVMGVPIRSPLGSIPTVRIIDPAGRTVLSQSADQAVTPQLPFGAYLLEIVQDGKRVEARKILTGR